MPPSVILKSSGGRACIRHKARESDWVRPFQRPESERKGYGVLFVTDRRVVFRFVASEPGVSVALGMGGFTSGGFFMKTYEQVTNVVKGDPPRPGYFGILYTDNGQQTGLILEPANDEPGVQAACEQMYEITRAAHQAALMQ